MPITQNESGRAFEYGLAVSLSTHLPAPIQDGPPIRKAKLCFEKCSYKEQKKIVMASDEASLFLIAHDNRLSDTGCKIRVQPDSAGTTGDVRDIVVTNTKLNVEIGISAKNRHHALKHSRLSEQIDFGRDWFQVPCSAEYSHLVVPVFRELRTRKRRGELWANIEDKKPRYYAPILYAFTTEMRRLFDAEPLKVASGLVHYALGRFDFYKVIKENGEVSLTSFNIDGTLKWGDRIPLPTRIIEILAKPKSETTVNITFDHGWQVSFRIHNAKKEVEPSLKFDINLDGMPATLSRHLINYG